MTSTTSKLDQKDHEQKQSECVDDATQPMTVVQSFESDIKHNYEPKLKKSKPKKKLSYIKSSFLPIRCNWLSQVHAH